MNMSTGMQGWMPPRIAHDLMWNRTVNVQGGRGNCIPLDRCNEHFNNSSKGVLKHSRNLSSKNLQRASDLGGPLGREVGEASSMKGAKRKGRKKRKAQDRDLLESFVELFSPNALFDTVPTRTHASFPGFELKQNIKEKRKGVLKSRLLYFSAQLDWAQIFFTALRTYMCRIYWTLTQLLNF